MSDVLTEVLLPSAFSCFLLVSCLMQSLCFVGQALLLLFVCAISSLGSSERLNIAEYYNASSGSGEAVWFRVFLVG